MDNVELADYIESQKELLEEQYDGEVIEGIIKVIGRERGQVQTQIKLKALYSERELLEIATEEKTKEIILLLKNYIYFLENKERIEKRSKKGRWRK